MSGQRERRGTDAGGLPAWRLLAAGVASAVGGDVVNLDGVALCPLPDDDGTWRSTLEHAVDHVTPGEVLVVTADRSWGDALITLASHGRWSRRRTPPLRKVRRALGGRGMRVEATYAVWPSARMPRIVLPRSELRMMRWMQGSGLLEGVGKPLPMQLFARSFLFTLLALRLPPAVALVARKAVSAP